MKHFFWVILLSSCTPPQDGLQQGTVDLDSLAHTDKVQSTEDADSTPFPQPAPSTYPSETAGTLADVDDLETAGTPADVDDLETAGTPADLDDLETPYSPHLSNSNDNDLETASSNIALIAQTLPISEPHAGSPGGVFADTLRIFQCDKLNANSQERFFLHVLNYRIHTLGAHPLCEVIQVTDVKKILTYANYQRKHCDEYTSNFIKERKQHQCTQIINLFPAFETPKT